MAKRLWRYEYTVDRAFQIKIRYPTERDFWTCWWWDGGKDYSGYGRFWNGTRTIGAHEFIYEALHGPIPKRGYDVHHICRNKPCVNPFHLQLLTKSEHRLEHTGEN